MITTFQALVVALLALLPGATYTFAFERFAGCYGSGTADRLVRLFAASACFVAVYSGPAVVLYHRYIASGALRRGEVNPVVIEVVAIGYIAIPAVLGGAVGFGKMRKWAWISRLVGQAREPRAWDHFWRNGDNTKMLRMKLKSGTWIGGVYGMADESQSYASGYPETGDIYLSQQLLLDPETGEYLTDNEDYLPCDTGLLVRWDEIEYLVTLDVRQSQEEE